MQLDEIKSPTLFYDGQCNLCNNAVQFVLSHEKNDQIMFASLQSELGKTLISRFNLKNIDSLVLYEDEQIYIKSNAALRVAKNLKSPYKSAHKLLFIPVTLRDLIYDIIAKYRYKFFGKTDSCQMPSEKTRNRFLDI